MYFTYILQSQSSGRYYIGSTQDLQKREVIHNQNKVNSTKNKGPWQLIYSESFTSRSEAYRRERKIKSYKGGVAFEKLLATANSKAD